jgi:hypothetical protein
LAPLRFDAVVQQRIDAFDKFHRVRQASMFVERRFILQRE